VCMCCSVFACIAANCSVLQCVAVCCNMLQCDAVCLHLIIISKTQRASESKITDFEIAIAV